MTELLTTHYGPVAFGLVALLVMWRAIVAPWMMQQTTNADAQRREQNAVMLQLANIIGDAAHKCENAAASCERTAATVSALFPAHKDPKPCTTSQPRLAE